MDGVIRKIVIGKDPKDAMAYYIGMRAGRGEVSAIVHDEKYLHRYGKSRYLIYLEGFYFATGSHTYLRSGDSFFFRNGSNQCIGSFSDGGGATFSGASASDYQQANYALEVAGLNGLNVKSSASALVSGQKTIVLRASGDKQWIDSYGVFKRNRQTVAENITVASTDNCMSAGPITINNGTTVTISSGGNWSIV